MPMNAISQFPPTPAPKPHDTLMTEDLPEAIRAVSDEIEYLTGMVMADTTHRRLKEQFEARRQRLERARAYLLGRIDECGAGRPTEN